MNHSSIDTTEDVTYTQLISLQTANKLIKGKSYRIVDFATRHTIPTSSDINTATTEPLVVTAEETNKLRPLVFSEAYPLDIIIYTISNTPIAGANKGCILFRHDTIKNISCHYDWRGVKFRDYGGIYGNWQNGGYSVNGINFPTGTVRDVLTFMDSADPSGVYNVHIGLKSPNDRLNNIVFFTVPATGSYARSLENIKIGDGCSEFRYINTSGVTPYLLKNINIRGGSRRITVTRQSTEISIGGNVSDVLMDGSRISIGNGSSFISFSGSVNIGMGCSQISVFAAGNTFIGDNCELINISGIGSFTGNVFDGSNRNINVLMQSNFMRGCKFMAGASYYTFDFNVNGNNVDNCMFGIPNTSNVTYNIPLSLENLSFTMRSPDGSIFANTVSNAGVIGTAIKLQ